MQKIASVHTSNLQKVKQQYQSFTLSWFGFGDGMGLIGESYNQTTQKNKIMRAPNKNTKTCSSCPENNPTKPNQDNGKD